MSVKTWAELVPGDVIVDKGDNTWTVTTDPEVVNSGGMVTVWVKSEARQVQLTQGAADPAPTVKADVPAELEELTHDAEVIAIETAKESAARTSDDPKIYPNGKDMGSLKLRTHLYLVHEYLDVAGTSGVTDMLIAHNKEHASSRLRGTKHEHFTSDN